MAFSRVRPELTAFVLMGATSLAGCNLEVNIHLDGDSADPAAPAPETAPAVDGPAAPEAPLPPDPPSWESSPSAPGAFRLPPVDAVIRDALWRPDEWPVPADESVPANVCESPTFTPFTVAPVIVNRQDVVRAMARAYPTDLRDEGIGGTVRIYFCIEADGSVANVVIDKSSGVAALDQAAMDVAGIYRFRAAKNREENVTAWVSFPMTFQVR